MASIVIMPKQGLLMEEGTIIQWLVPEGGQVAKGEPLFEMETDKLTLTIDSEVSGTVLKILHPEGDVVKITKPIAIIGEPGEDVSSLVLEKSEDVSVPKATESAVTEEKIQLKFEPAKDKKGRVFATPRAKFVAEEKGVQIQDVTGSGEDGLIRERDVLAYVMKSESAKKAELMIVEKAFEVKQEPVGRGTHLVPITAMRKAISENMLNSKRTNAQTNHRIEVDMTEAVILRGQFKSKGINISYNDIITKVCAKALQEMPIVNASMTEDENNILYHDYVNIGIAVSVKNGLIVPVIKDADLIGLAEVAKKSADLIERARTNTLSFEDYHGGTFTISSLGMFGLDSFVAIINPPESAILAVGKIEKKPVVATDELGNDVVVIKQMCNLCLSYDHRIIDGADAANFLKLVKKYLQNPLLML